MSEVRGHRGDDKYRRAGHDNPPPDQLAALAQFESEVGGRDRLVEHLNHASLTKEQEYLVGLIADPANTKKSLATIAKIARVPFGQLIKFFQEAGFVRAQLAAFEKIWTNLPEVAGDVMAKAVPRDVECPTCGGDGNLSYTIKPEGWKKGEPLDYETRPCNKCFGKKTVRIEPEHDVQKTALEIGGLLKRGVNVGVQVGVQNTQNFAFLGVDHLRDFRAATDKILFPSRRGEPYPEEAPAQPTEEVVDAEIVQPPVETE